MLTVKLNNGNYLSPPAAPGWLSSKLPSVCFYPRAFKVVLQAALMAKKGIYTEGDWAKSSLDILRALELSGVEFAVSGMEHVCASTEPCVFIGNHMSTLETFVLPTLIAPYRSNTFVVKNSLVDYPLFKWVMRSRNPIVVNRTNPRDDLKTVLNDGCDRLAHGMSVIVFPQTTRTTDFNPENFNSIGVKLARKAGVPIIPIALKTDAWNNGHLLKDFGVIDPHKKVHFEFGQPIDSAGKAGDIQETIVEFIQTRLQNW
ncbi:MAG: lysophospholipid acyltransferase family protein [Desulfuromonas sp.]|nr:lysophospholipid acyltransferase family protein [Desulfuromonas sp.]